MTDTHNSAQQAGTSPGDRPGGAPPMKIFCFTTQSGFGNDLLVVALSADGKHSWSHVSSSVSWAKRDIGFLKGSHYEWRHEQYAEAYPDGYELEWLEIEDVPQELLRERE